MRNRSTRAIVGMIVLTGFVTWSAQQAGILDNPAVWTGQVVAGQCPATSINFNGVLTSLNVTTQFRAQGVQFSTARTGGIAATGDPKAVVGWSNSMDAVAAPSGNSGIAAYYFRAGTARPASPAPTMTIQFVTPSGAPATVMGDTVSFYARTLGDVRGAFTNPGRARSYDASGNLIETKALFGDMSVLIPQTSTYGGRTYAQLAAAMKVQFTKGTIAKIVLDDDWTTGVAIADLSFSSGCNNAVCVGNTIPDRLLPDQSFTATATVGNNGTKTWTGNAYYAGIKNFASWGLTNAGASWAGWPGASIAPGQSATLNISGKAPSTPGNYAYNYQMLQNGVESFGAVCGKTIIVEEVTAGLPFASVPGACPVSSTDSLTRVRGMTIAPDGNVWMANNDSIVRVDAQKQYKVFPVSSGSGVDSIASDASGFPWYNGVGAGKIARLNLTGLGAGSVTTFNVPGDTVGDIALGPDNNVWVTLHSAADTKVAKINGGGGVTAYAVRSGTGGSARNKAIASGADGFVYYTDERPGIVNKVSVTGVESAINFTSPAVNAGSTQNGVAEDIAPGPDGNVWFTVPLSNSIGKITPAGAVTMYLVPAQSGRPVGIAKGPDNRMWFTTVSAGGGGIGSITSTGSVKVTRLYGASSAGSASYGFQSTGLAADASNNVWFSFDGGSPESTRLHLHGDASQCGRIGCSIEQGSNVIASQCRGTDTGGLCTVPWTKSIVFSKPFANVPHVLVTPAAVPFGVTTACYKGSTDQIICRPKDGSITNTGFTLECSGSPPAGSCPGYDERFMPGAANWIAVDSLSASCAVQSGHGFAPACTGALNADGTCSTGFGFKSAVTFPTPFATSPRMIAAPEVVSSGGGCIKGTTDTLVCWADPATPTKADIACSGSPSDAGSTCVGNTAVFAPTNVGWLAMESTDACRVVQGTSETVDCPGQIVGGTCTSPFEKTVVFPTPFAKAPFVIVSPSRVSNGPVCAGVATGTDNVTCGVVGVTEKDFRVRCSGSYINDSCGIRTADNFTKAEFRYMVIDADCSDKIAPSYAQCADGVDNDSDGKTDYPADPDCSSLTDDNETAQTCTDSDGGNKPLQKGFVNATGGSLATAADSCNLDGTLKEYFCDTNQSIQFVTNTCDAGFSCVDGACRAGSSSSAVSANSARVGFGGVAFDGNDIIFMPLQNADMSYHGNALSYGPVCKPGACGDGTPTSDEQCDDGNTRDGDGCSAKCIWEPYAVTVISSSSSFRSSSSLGTSVSSSSSPRSSSSFSNPSSSSRSSSSFSNPSSSPRSSAQSSVVRCIPGTICPTGDICPVNGACPVASSSAASVVRCIPGTICPTGDICPVNGACPVASSSAASVVRCIPGTICPTGDICPVNGSCPLFDAVSSSSLSSVRSCIPGTICPTGDVCPQNGACPAPSGLASSSAVSALSAARGSACVPGTVCSTGGICAQNGTCPGSGDFLSQASGLCGPGLDCPGNAGLCGNGFLDPGEICDDGNGAGNDGCTAACLLPNGAPCTGPRQCDSLICGDGACVPCVSDNQCPGTMACINGACAAVNPLDPDGDGMVVLSDGFKLSASLFSQLGADLRPESMSYEDYVRRMQQHAAGHAPVGNTGPESVAIMAAGASAGYAWMKMRKMKKVT